MEKPVICKVKGLFNFDAKSSDEISFKKDDILDIIAIETTMWWTARNQDGFVGHIPANYVRLMESIKEPFQSSQEKTPEATNCESFKPAAKEKRSEDETEYVIAKFSFKRRTEKELSLRKGDVIDVIQKADNGWWEGKLGNRIGWFPANCVAAENFNVGSAHGVDSPAILHRVKCKYTFLAQDPDDLSCEVGDILDVIDKAEPYPGWRLMRNQDGIEGLVPINYMTILDTDIEPAVDEIESASASSAKEKRRDDETETVIARFSYKGSEGDELSFKKGDVIDVIRKASDGWWKGKLGERIGLFPANYVTEYSVHEFGPGAMHKVKCKLNFKAEEPDELSCEKGEFLYLIKPEDEPGSRWLMRNQDGIEGLVPLSHVTILDTDIEPAVDEIESASASSAKGESGLEALPVPKPKKPKGFISSARQFLQKLSRKQKKKSKDYSVRSNSSVLLASSSTSSSSKDETKQPKQSTVPREILARGPLALRAYLNALSEGMTFTKRVPLMLIGQSRSGKTSLKKSLKGQAFNRNEASTVGVDVDPSHFKVSTEIWKTGQKNQESNFDTAFSYEHQAAQLIAGSLMAEKQMSEESPRSVTVEKQMPEESPSLVTAVTGDLTEESESGSSVNSSSFPASDSLSLKEDPTAKEDDLKSGQSKMTFPNISYSSASACKFPLKDSEPTDASAEDVASSSKWDKPGTSKVPDEVATLVEKLLHEDRKEKDENDVYSVLWDFGGQSVYYVTHPLFLTPRAIYLLVYDLSRSPRDKADPLARQGMFRKFEDNCSLKTNLDYLDFWMTSVASLASEGSTHQVCPNTLPLPEKLPPVFLVCTHGDEPHGGMDSRTLASEIFDCLQNKPYSAHLFERVFVVDNTKSGGETECPEVLRLRQEILAVTKELPQMKEAIPIKWLQYEKELQVMKEDGIRWISLEQAKQIASKVCRIVEDQEILTLLNFLHDQRILIHFDDTPELNRLVVLDPQWLIDVFKKVITVKPYDHEEREFKELWRKLEKTGIVQEELLKHVWSPLVDEQETSESLIAIMEKFSLMCLWPLSEASCGKQYLVPSMLMSHPPQGIMNLLESVQIPSLFLKFESGQIPPSLFPRLVLQFFQWCTNEFPNSLDPQLFHNFARFYISPDEGCSVVLLCHPSAVEVVVLRENHTTDRDEDSQSMVSLSSDDPNQRTFEVARAVRRQLVMMLDCMKDEFCWLKNMRYEVSFLCPVCSQGGTVNYCRTHHVLGCQQRECLHLWPESELCKYSQAVVCRESADAVETRIQVKRFAPWFIHSDAAEKKPKDEGNGSGLPLTQAPDMERDENKTLALPCAVQDALQSQSCDAKDVVVRLQEDLQLEEAASSLENTEPRTKMMIRCLAREAKCSSRLDVVTHLRKVTPAGTTGGNEWMTVAERLGLKPAEIRFLERRYVNPFEAALQHCRNQRYLNVGQLYDVLVDCDLPVFADLL